MPPRAAESSNSSSSEEHENHHEHDHRGWSLMSRRSLLQHNNSNKQVAVSSPSPLHTAGTAGAGTAGAGNKQRLFLASVCFCCGLVLFIVVATTSTTARKSAEQNIIWNANNNHQNHQPGPGVTAGGGKKQQPAMLKTKKLTSSSTTTTLKRKKNKKYNNNLYTDPHAQSLPDAASTDSSPFISWTMENVDYNSDNTYREIYNEIYSCDGGGEIDRLYERADLPISLRNKMWFHTSIETNLNILVMGDSVAMEIAELLQETMQITRNNRVLLRSLDNDDLRHESLFWGSNGESGGGSAGGWRIVHWWLRRNAGRPLPEEHGGGWTIKDTKQLRHTIAEYSSVSADSGTGDNIKDNVDVLVFRVSQPWMAWNTMTTIQVAYEQLEIKMVVFVTIPFSNNIVTEDDVHQMHVKNKMIKDFVRTYSTSDDRIPGITVMYWDLGQLHDKVLKVNAQELGFPVSRDDPENYHFAMSTLYQPPDLTYFSKSIAHVCGEEMVPNGSRDCEYYNMITFDGQHLCMKTFAGRLFAGLACVIRCATSYSSSFSAEKEQEGLLRECEEACNAQYMSLQPLDASFFAGPA